MQSSLRQAITPDRLRGRVNACHFFLTTGVRPFGALLGGVLGEAIGLPSTLVVGTLGVAFAAVWLLLSPVRAVREAPSAAEPDAATGAIMIEQSPA